MFGKNNKTFVFYELYYKEAFFLSFCVIFFTFYYLFSSSSQFLERENNPLNSPISDVGSPDKYLAAQFSIIFRQTLRRDTILPNKNACHYSIKATLC
jgi:hypothetical protein